MTMQESDLRAGLPVADFADHALIDSEIAELQQQLAGKGEVLAQSTAADGEGAEEAEGKAREFVLVAGRLGSLLSSRQRYPEAEVVLRLALLDCQKRGDAAFIAALMYGVGVALAGQERFAESEFFLREALLAAIESGDASNLADAASALAWVLGGLGRADIATKLLHTVQQALAEGAPLSAADLEISAS